MNLRKLGEISIETSRKNIGGKCLWRIVYESDLEKLRNGNICTTVVGSPVINEKYKKCVLCKGYKENCQEYVPFKI